ncbi:MAG: 2-polyprenyl-3-methyl-5-hydroxy-6-metoxy-1,4-benzoquinol methylase [Chlamydiales bacterium]|jgi:2-polyprenyl-3-methyl-5-hydroxy-6-metoxy-1,4-benzoquinol methylase
MSDAAAVTPIFSDLGVSSSQLQAADGQPGPLWFALPAGSTPGHSFFEHLKPQLGEDSPLLVGVPGHPDERELAAWRNALWPWVHVFALYRCKRGETRRQTLQGRQSLEQPVDFEGVILAGRRRTHVMSPAATVEKFDANAKGWDGTPGSPGYAHFRWMRRYVAMFGAPASAKRILDFGCGAGWVGIEAAMARPGAELCSFDPSPEMVKITEANAQAAGIATFTGRTGFGEEPPFPAQGEQPFDWVLSSGVLSFSPDLERWVEGVTDSVAPGGTLVVGDIHRDSRGFRNRRSQKPLLPVRELNARTRDEIIPMLEARGFEHVRSAGYQLTRPIPEAMYVSETKLKGLLNPPLLWLNRIAAAVGSGMPNQFDSWVSQLVKSRD